AASADDEADQGEDHRDPGARPRERSRSGPPAPERDRRRVDRPRGGEKSNAPTEQVALDAEAGEDQERQRERHGHRRPDVEESGELGEDLGAEDRVADIRRDTELADDEDECKQYREPHRGRDQWQVDPPDDPRPAEAEARGLLERGIDGAE